MAAATRTDLANAALFTTWINRNAVPTLESELVLYRMGVPQTIPAGSGDTVQVQFAQNLAASSAAVHELATGVANQVSYTTASMRIRFYANDVQMSQLAEAINEVDYRGGSLGRLMYNGAQVADLVARDALETMTTNIIRAGVAATDAAFAATDLLVMDDLNKATTLLQVGDVQYHRMTAGAYCGAFHPRVCGDLRADTGTAGNAQDLTWYDFSRRNDASAFENASIGRTLSIEVKQSTNIRRFTNANGVAIYNNFVVGDWCFMTGSISGLPTIPAGERGGRPAIHLIPPTPSVSLPYANLWVMSYAYYAAGGLIDDNRGVMVKAASAA